MTAQARGLSLELSALAAAAAGGGEVDIVDITARPPAILRLLPPLLASRFVPLPDVAAPPGRVRRPPADIVVGCGGGAQAAVLAIRRRCGTFAVCVQRPSANESAFDAIVAPAHDYSDKEISAIQAADATKSNIILTTGAVGLHAAPRLLAARQKARARFAAYRPPYIAVLLGGENRAFRMDAPRLTAQLSEVAKKSGATLLITVSRRSGADLPPLLAAAFGGTHYLWDGRGDNPYADILAAADGFCVTCDSVNMISEACAAGRGVYLLPLENKSGARATRAAQKFTRFHTALAERGNIRWWQEKWEEFSAPPLDCTARAAAATWALFRRRAEKAQKTAQAKKAE